LALNRSDFFRPPQPQPQSAVFFAEAPSVLYPEHPQPPIYITQEKRLKNSVRKESRKKNEDDEDTKDKFYTLVKLAR
jgi:hypothetical protein